MMTDITYMAIHLLGGQFIVTYVPNIDIFASALVDLCMKSMATLYTHLTSLKVCYPFSTIFYACYKNMCFEMSYIPWIIQVKYIVMYGNMELLNGLWLEGILISKNDMNILGMGTYFSTRSSNSFSRFKEFTFSNDYYHKHCYLINQ